MGRRAGLTIWCQGKEGRVSWPAKIKSISEWKRLQCYQLSVFAPTFPQWPCQCPRCHSTTAGPCAAQLRFTGRRKPPQSQREKEQGAPPTAEDPCACTRCSSEYKHKQCCARTDTRAPSTSWCTFCGIWLGIYYTTRKVRPACGINNTLTSTAGKPSG